MTGDPIDLLVIGAGPAGLTLALQAHTYGAQVRIIEQRPEPFRPSRAMIMHPRTLEVLRPLGVIDALLTYADVTPEIDLHLGRRTARIRLEQFGVYGSPFPRPMLLRQSDVEAVLSDALAARGVRVERGVELIDFDHKAAPITAIARSATGQETITCQYLAGCDGVGSTVRTRAGIAWQGGPYCQEVLLADVDLAPGLAPGVAHVIAERAGLVFLFPLGERAAWRMLATRPAIGDDIPFGQFGPGPPDQDLQRLLTDAGLQASISHVRWSARVRLQHRIAATLRTGHVFLVGEAAHVHSPAGGQGMNTAIQDAVNLGWKLAFLSRASRPDEPDGVLLTSYDQERRRVARRVLALTHLIFWGEAGTGWVPSFVRGVLAPLAAPLVPLMLRSPGILSAALWLLGEFWVDYWHSPLSTDLAPKIRIGPRPGERLANREVTCEGQQIRLHDLIVEPGIHVLLDRDAGALDEAALAPCVRVHRLSSRPGKGVLIIRPDGYVGFRAASLDVEQVTGWLAVATGQRG
jgi:2-polyprenyl-6-methoxyphenol hydroxylase-like FAD-dependent oxidoreductase